MPRPLTHSLAAIFAVALCFASFGVVTNVPAQPPLAASSAPALA